MLYRRQREERGLSGAGVKGGEAGIIGGVGAGVLHITVMEVLLCQIEYFIRAWNKGEEQIMAASREQFCGPRSRTSSHTAKYLSLSPGGLVYDINGGLYSIPVINVRGAGTAH